jgi:carbon monoxide dehydrogenase subunit G
MPTATYRGHIRATPEAVFAFVSDAENNPRWHAHVRDTHWIDPPPTRLGRRGRQFGHLFFRDWAFVAEVAEWEPPHAVTFQVIDGYRVRTAIRVEPDGDGSQVELTVTTPRILGGRVDALASRVLKRVTRRRENGDFRRLREALER